MDALEPCECGATGWNNWDISATLIRCRSCGRTWGRVNGVWVFDHTTEPGYVALAEPVERCTDCDAEIVGAHGHCPAGDL